MSAAPDTETSDPLELATRLKTDLWSLSNFAWDSNQPDIGRKLDTLASVADLLIQHLSTTETNEQANH